MAHSLSKIWLHVISGTKNRLPLIDFEAERFIYEHLSEQLTQLNCKVEIINGMPDHVHCLFLQNPRICIDDILKQIKGNTSHWINQNDVVSNKFAWQTGYGAFSVSESQLKLVASYIANQKEHHKKISFDEEYESLIKLHGL